VWLKWMVGVMSHVLLLALGFFAAWIFFPRQQIFFVDPRNHTAIEAPPGTRINPDGTLSVPMLRETEPSISDKNGKPASPQNAPQPEPAQPKKDSEKDQNAPRK
jgi:hypothetical protein